MGIFSECASFTDDAYWKDLFNECDENRFPKGLRYDETKNKLYVRADSKTTVYKVPSDARMVYDLMMTIFTDVLHMLSPTDRERRNQEMIEMLHLDDVEWKQASRSKTSKNLLVSSYVERLSEIYKLTFKECKNLFSLINLAFQFKKISAENVTFDNGEIEHIDGLLYDEATRTFTIEGTDKHPTKTSKTVKQDQLYKNIDNYLRDYMSRYRIV